MLELTNHVCKQLAMSRNHERAGDDPVPYMSIAYDEALLGEEEIDALMGEYTYRSWFNINGQDIQPLEWTKKVELSCADAFKDVSVSMKLAGNRELEFDGCRLYIDRFKLLSGGEVSTKFHIHVLGAKDSEWNLIGRAEYTEVRLSIGDGVVIERKARKQRGLFEGPDPEAPKEAEIGAGFAAAASSRTGDLEQKIWWQHGVTGEKGTGARKDMPAGAVEIDPPAGGLSEREQTQAAGKNGADDSQAFEDGVARAVGAHKKRGSNVIDGRSERVKHQERQRNGEADSAH